jgi:hypothetical protein
MRIYARIIGLYDIILAFGYPLETMEEERDLFEEDRVHYEKW